MKNKIKKTAIFGGSFDPPHFGHIDIVKNLENRFDKVIVMPSYISPFKTSVSADAARFKLCKKVFTSEKTEVSRYEIGKKGVSYSVDTATYLAKKTEGELYWVIGSEELLRLEQWRDIDKLKTLVKFYVVPRPMYDANEELLKRLKKRKIKIKFAPFSGLDISSTRIRIDMAFLKYNSFMPYAVYDYAVKHDLFNPYQKYVYGLYSGGTSYRRIEHSYRTALRGAELAKMYGASVDDAVIACILHDNAKGQRPERFADDVDFTGFPAPTMHGPMGAYVAQIRYGVSNEIADAIKYHSTARRGMTVLDEIVYLADKTESGRNYESLQEIRFLCSTDKNRAMLAALKEIRALNETEPCKFTDEAIEYYEELCNGGKKSGLRKNDPAPAPESVQTEPEPEKTTTDAPDGKEQSAPKQFVSTGDEVKDIAVVSAAELSLHKAHDVDIVSLNGKTIIADYFVIASASSTTAVKALMGYVEDKLTKQFGINPNKRDINSDWIALDYGNVIIHIFTDKTREFYNIERLWSDGDNIQRYED